MILPQPRYIPGVGPSRPRLVICGEAGGFYEDRDGIPFAGPTGSLVNEMLRANGLDRDEVWLTNVVKYKPPRNKLKLLPEIGINLAHEQQKTLTEVQSLDANCILLLGGLAMETFIAKDVFPRGKKPAVKHYRGSILPTIIQTKSVTSYHPAALFPKGESDVGAIPWKMKKVIEHDFARAVAESSSKTIDIKEPTIEIARCAADVMRFREKYKDRVKYPYLFTDIESQKSFPTCIGISYGPDHVLVIPLINPVYRVLQRVHEVELAIIWQLVYEILNDPLVRLVGCNWKYDQERLWRICKILSKMPYADIAIMHHCLYAEFPKSLEYLTSIFTRHPFYKSELQEGNRNSNFDDVMRYNGKDVAYTAEIFFVLLKELEEMGQVDFCFNFVMKMHPLYFEMEQNGFYKDAVRTGELWFKYSALEARLEKEFRDLCDGRLINIRSVPQVRKLLYGPNSTCKFKEPYRRNFDETEASTDEKTLTYLLATARNEVQERVPWLVLKLRQIKKVKSDYLSAETDPDGRLRSTWKIAGTETLRSATGVVGGPMRPVQTGISYSTIVKHSEYGQDVREMLIAPPGYVIGNADLSQAEPRIVAHLARDEETLAKMNSGTIDIHKEMAGVCFNLSDADAQAMAKSDPRRFVGKTSANAMRYDAGGGELSMTINTDAKKYGIPIARISRWQADQYLVRAHARYPKIRSIFHRDIQDAIHASSPPRLLDPFGGQRIFCNRMGRELYKEAYAHIPQKTVRLQVARAMLGIKEEEPNFIFVNEAHDAINWFSRPEDFERHALLVKKWFELPIDFSRCSLPRGLLMIPCDVEWGTNYGELRKYTFGERVAA